MRDDIARLVQHAEQAQLDAEAAVSRLKAECDERVERLQQEVAEAAAGRAAAEAATADVKRQLEAAQQHLHQQSQESSRAQVGNSYLTIVYAADTCCRSGESFFKSRGSWPSGLLWLLAGERTGGSRGGPAGHAAAGGAGRAAAAQAASKGAGRCERGRPQEGGSGQQQGGAVEARERAAACTGEGAAGEGVWGLYIELGIVMSTQPVLYCFFLILVPGGCQC
jgi:hypothetical protein